MLHKTAGLTGLQFFLISVFKRCIPVSKISSKATFILRLLIFLNRYMERSNQLLKKVNFPKCQDPKIFKKNIVFKMSTHAFYKLIPSNFDRSILNYKSISFSSSFFVFCLFENFNAIHFDIRFCLYCHYVQYLTIL